MTRIAPIPPERMDDRQRAIHDGIIAAGRRADRGPFSVLLHAPEIAEPLAGFVDHFLSETRVPVALKETAILTIARAYTAQYEWFAHEPRARKAGVADAAIEAIRHRRAPEFGDAAQQLVHAMTTEIVERRGLGDDHYERAVAALGETTVVELVTMIGVYTALAILMASYDVDIPDGNPLPLPV